MKALLNVQNELKAPKNQYNDFGKYKYRSAEDILEAVKPLLKKYGLILTLSDTIEEVGGRVYVCAHACLSWEGEGNPMNGGTPPGRIEVKAYAREAEAKKGMDESQVTGTASSYARKYALNGLFLIDDTKDADTNQYKEQTAKAEPEQFVDEIISARNAKDIKSLLQETGANVPAFLEYYGVKSVEELTRSQYADAVKRLSKKEKHPERIEIK